MSLRVHSFYNPYGFASQIIQELTERGSVVREVYSVADGPATADFAAPLILDNDTTLSAFAPGPFEIIANNGSIAVGGASAAFGRRSVAIGLDARTPDKGGVPGPEASNVAIGPASGVGAPIPGLSTKITRNSIAIGSNASYGAYAGTGLFENTICIGRFSDASATNAITIGSFAGFKGFGPSSEIGTAEGSICLGTGSTAFKAFGVAIGGAASCTGTQAVAIGGVSAPFATDGAKANGDQSVAIGAAAETSAVNAVALGNAAAASAEDAVALGDSSVASGDDAVALGSNAQATANQTVALGLGAQASALQALSLGSASEASGQASIALGNGCLASADNAIALGNGTTAATGVVATAQLGLPTFVTANSVSLTGAAVTLPTTADLVVEVNIGGTDYYLPLFSQV